MAENQIISLKRIAIEAVVIVGSILLAFAIDARWDDHQDRQREKEILEGLLTEFELMEEQIQWDRKYYGAMRASALKLVDIGMGVEESVSDEEIDHLLEDLWWWSLPSHWSSSELQSIIAGGHLALISNDTLRHDIGSWAIRLDQAVDIINEEKDFYRSRLMPYLSKHVSLQQLLLVAEGAPGHPGGSWGTVESWGHPIRIKERRAHREMLSQLELQNLLIERASLLNDMMNFALGSSDEGGQMSPYIRPTIEMIEQELAK